MASFSDWTEDGILNLIVNKQAFPADLANYDVHLALFKSEAGLENNTPGIQQEVADVTSYRRLKMSDFGGYTTAVGGTCHNAGDVDFPTALADWGLITHTALMDSAALGTGNVIMWAPLANPRTVYAGDTMRVREGAHVITLT